ncbi:MAG: hypothetical protein IJQ02_07810 [Oscillospiraceae bacterium]|nr:hypothetical protein [Oscillospiraceae bacterium]
MYTSDKGRKENRSLHVIGVYLLETVCCALFGAVYERFSHGVYSYFMLYAFAFPLILGVIPSFLMDKAGAFFPGKAAADCLHAGILALTVGSIMQGVLEIYGTTNPLNAVYWAVGAACLAAGCLMAAKQAWDEFRSCDRVKAVRMPR